MLFFLLGIPSTFFLAYFYGVRVGLRHGRTDCKRAYDLGRQDAIRALMV